MTNLYANLKVKKEKAEAHISGEVPWTTLEAYYNREIEALRKDFEAPGFRKGNVPLEIFKSKVNELRVLEGAAEAALQEAYPAMLDAEKLDVLGRPEVAITKLAMGNPAEFKIRVGLAPEVKLPDYKKIAAKVVASMKPVSVEDKEMEEVITSLRKLRAAPSTTSETNADGSEKKADEPKEAELPPLTDEFVKTLGSFENVEDFRTKLRQNMQLEKENENKRTLRENLAEKLAAETKMELPELLLEDEAREMFVRLQADLDHAGLTLEDYLKRAGKTEEDIRKDQRAYAERQIKTRFILEEIAKAEAIEPDANDVAVETKLLRERHPDLDEDRIEKYVRNLLRNEKVLEFLEKPEEKQ